ncbi:hypothetical protein J31TS4_32280 [Paenibacillus sp. J31TS4]|nr:hypothetical protein J31TS4_32280 [Paenibacillus sp. J31TS4]
MGGVPAKGWQQGCRLARAGTQGAWRHRFDTANHKPIRGLSRRHT